MGDSIIPMSYSQLDKLYDKATLIVDSDYNTKIGGVYRPWDVFNHNELVIQDSVTFANVSSKYGASSQFIESPWKIHLSIQPEDLGKAWDIIYPILKAHQIPLFKTSRLSVSRILYIQMQKAAPGFLEQHNINSEEKKQSIQDIVRVFNGMQITIYIENGKEHEYNNILSEIEPLLYAAGINPGIIDKSDRAIGFYSSIRHVGKGYTSHDKVFGYKQVTERDPFYAIHPKLKDVRINWSTFDYSNHIIKAKVTLEQLVDAKRKYDLALITKREYHQSCDVASEYFKRWYELIKRTLVPSQLSTYNNLSLVKFKKWINDGHRLIPALRKERLQNFKEAEDILHANDQYRAWDLSRPRIKRNQGQRNLLNLLSPRQTLVKTPSKSEQVENKSDTVIILKKLSEHRKKPLLIRSLARYH